MVAGGKRSDTTGDRETHPSTPKGVADLFQIPRVVFNSGFVQHYTQLFQIRTLTVMFRLIVDVCGDDRLRVRTD